MKLNKEIVEKVRTSIYALPIENQYKNLAYFSGWVINKPTIVKHDKTGKESVSLVIVQFMRNPNGYAHVKTFNLVSYIPSIIEQFKKQKKVCYIICDCQFQWNTKLKQTYPSIYDMKIPFEIRELDLVEEK